MNKSMEEKAAHIRVQDYSTMPCTVRKNFRPDRSSVQDTYVFSGVDMTQGFCIVPSHDTDDELGTLACRGFVC